MKFEINLESLICMSVGVAGIVVALGTRRKHKDICDMLNRSIDSISENIEVEIAESIINRAVEKAVDREAGRAAERVSDNILKSTRNKVTLEVKKVIDDNYKYIRKDVEKKLIEEVQKLDITELQKEVRKDAAEKVAYKFNGCLDDILERFNGQLADVQKIYQSISNTFSSNGRDVTLRL